jgi:hypothetical protein
MTPEEFAAYLQDLAAQHGGQLGEPRIIDPIIDETIMTPTGEVKTGGSKPNPTPTYEYRFKDGTTIRAKGSGGDPHSSTPAIIEIVGGNAGVDPTAESGAKTVNTADGRTLQWNPETKRYDIEVGKKESVDPTPAVTTTAKQIWARKPDGTMGWVDNPNYVPPKAEKPFEQQKKETVEMILAEGAAKAKLIFDQRQKEYELGIVETPEQKRQRDYEIAMLTEEYKAKVAKARSDEEWARAIQSQQMQRNQALAGIYSKQAEAGMSAIDRAVGVGVAPTALAMQGMVFDPRARALDLIGQAMQGIDFDPRARALDLIGGQLQPQAPMAAPTTAPRLGIQAPRVGN